MVLLYTFLKLSMRDIKELKSARNADLRGTLIFGIVAHKIRCILVNYYFTNLVFCCFDPLGHEIVPYMVDLAKMG